MSDLNAVALSSPRSGLALAATGLVLFARAPVDGRFLVDVLPGMVLPGLGAIGIRPNAQPATAAARRRELKERLTPAADGGTGMPQVFVSFSGPFAPQTRNVATVGLRFALPLRPATRHGCETALNFPSRRMTAISRESDAS